MITRVCRWIWSRLPGQLGLRASLCVATVLLTANVSSACIGAACLNIWSTEEGGGALTVDWDFAGKKIQTFKSLCAGGECLYSGIDPGFRYEGAPAPDGFHTLFDGTDVSLEIVNVDLPVTLRINGAPLKHPGDIALLGTTPELHSHPSWQLSVDEGELGDFALAFKLKTGSAAYSESQVFVLTLTNLPTPTPEVSATTPTPEVSAATPTPTATQAPSLCAGDCNGDDGVAISEIILGVSAALSGTSACGAFDTNGDGMTAVNEIIAAVNSALTGCENAPTRTPVAAVNFDMIQSTIFSPRCAVPTCHDTAGNSGNLILAAGRAYDQLVGVPPVVDTAREAGVLRVDPSRPDNSFLIIKLEGPPPDQGSRMPMTGPALTAAEIETVRTWIAQGAVR